MIGRSIRVSCGRSRRLYSVSPLSFIPNEDKHRFEGEKLSPEENAAAIPDRPQLEPVQKYHHTIINPEDVADLVTKANINDALITVLSKDATFLGNLAHKIVNIDSSKEPEAAKLRFANIGFRWIEIFNKQIEPLADVPKSSGVLSFQNKSVKEKISGKYSQALSNEDFNLYTPENLSAFYISLRAFKHSERRLQGLLSPSELSYTIFFENVTLFLIDTKEVKESAENFEVLISFLEENSRFCTSQNLKEILIHLIDNLYESKLPSIQPKLASFNNFLNSQEVQLANTEYFGLEPATLDKLAFLMAVSDNTSKTLQILSILIKKRRVCPSTDTLNTFLSSYQRTHATQDKASFLRNMTTIKSALFHRSLSSVAFKVILDNAVEDILDLQHFLRLIIQGDKSTQLLTKFQFELFSKLEHIQSSLNTSPLESSLQYTQLVTQLIENDVTFNDQTLDLLREKYTSFGAEHNIDILTTLKKA
ncbi:uncharacterized protein RJT20DRAFT_126311 [Scheffersomyces xylosifermentans]|uniref:uncharacterized protein n=1 Tax=Scheffersomyces xylosifermentans TaxID=1304137 RepID=UPI00315C7469